MDQLELQRLQDDGNPHDPPDPAADERPTGPDCRECMGWGCHFCLYENAG